MAEERAILARSNITACQRCRRRKQKCDQKLPKCRLCQKAGVECVSIDAVTQQQIPRSYVHSLEERVAFLENTLLLHGITEYEGSDASGVTTVSPVPQPACLPALVCTRCAAEVDRAGNVVAGLAGQLGLETADEKPCSTFADALLQQLYVAEAMRDGPSGGAAEDDGYGLLPVQELDTSPAQLPEPKTAEHLIRVFFELSNFSLPILHEPSFRQRVAALMERNSDDQNSQDPRATFFAFIVFGIALLTLQKHDSVKVSTSLCERYYAAALGSLSAARLPDNVEGVQALLLISLYSYLHPRAFQPWQTVGMAVRLAVSLGLHRDETGPTGPEPDLRLDFRQDLRDVRTHTNFDPLTLDTRRRVFWAAYAMDRTVASVLGRPFAISDGAISCPFPSAVDDIYITADGIPADAPVGKKAFGLHYLRYRQLQSEIQVVLYEKRPFGYAESSPAGLDYSAWQRRMHAHLNQWLATQPSFGTAAPSCIAPAEALDLAFHQAVLLLYRPSSAIPRPIPAALLLLIDAAIAAIQLYRRLHRENKLRLFWQAVHNLFAAGTALLHCYTHAAAVRARMPLRSLEASVYACSAVLWAMVERFPAAKGTRDAFDVLATAALDALSAEDGRASSTETCTNDSFPSTDLTAWNGTLGDMNTENVLSEMELSPSLFQGSLGMLTWL